MLTSPCPPAGFAATDAEVETSVRSYVDAHFDEIATSGGWKALGKTSGQMKQLDHIKWADATSFKNAVDAVFTERFGDKAQADAAAKEAAAKAKAVKVAVPAKPLAEVSTAFRVTGDGSGVRLADICVSVWVRLRRRLCRTCTPTCSSRGGSRACMLREETSRLTLSGWRSTSKRLEARSLLVSRQSLTATFT